MLSQFCEVFTIKIYHLPFKNSTDFSLFIQLRWKTFQLIFTQDFGISYLIILNCEMMNHNVPRVKINTLKSYEIEGI